MLWVLSAVIGLIIGAAVVWIIQTTARSKEAAQARMESQTLQEQLNVAGADLKVAQARAQMLENSLEEQKEARKAEAEAMRREYDEKLQKMVLTFKDSAAEILKEKSRDLSAVNSEQIKNILDPLGKKMEEFRRAVEDSKEKSLKNSASIEQQIRSMMEQTMSIGKQADNLATALRSNNKTVGNSSFSIFSRGWDCRRERIMCSRRRSRMWTDGLSCPMRTAGDSCRTLCFIFRRTRR